MASPQDEFVFLPLGGLGEIGMNAALYGFGPETNRQWILVDCGIGFAGEEGLPGVDLMFPDLSFIEEERDNLLAIFATPRGRQIALRSGGTIRWRTPYSTRSSCRTP